MSYFNTVIFSLCLVLASVLCLPSSVFAQDKGFDWSWEQDGKKAEAPAAAVQEPAVVENTATNDIADPSQIVEDEVLPPGEAAKPDVKAEGFNWSWEQDGKKPAAEPKPKAADVQTDVPANATAEDLLSDSGKKAEVTGIDAEAYNRLVKENLALRGTIDQASKTEDSYKKENTKLATEIADLEKKTAEFALMISDMKGKTAGIPDGEKKLSELEEKLSVTEREKTSLVSSMNALQEKISQLELEKQQIARTATASATAGVSADSDLFKEKERENAMLKQKLVQIESERMKILDDSKQIAEKMSKTKGDTSSAMKKQDELKTQLADVKESERKHKKALEELLKQMPALEEKLVELKGDSVKKGTQIVARDQELDAMKLELERREYRLAKAERMAKIMEKARDDIRKFGDKEKRDMHYNMATVYSKEGHFEDAEKEFLNALRIDPSDADVHYNLAVLYDDSLNDKTKAAMHYRRYIALNPYASDIDQVKTWLIDIEVGGNKSK